ESVLGLAGLWRAAAAGHVGRRRLDPGGDHRRHAGGEPTATTERGGEGILSHQHHFPPMNVMSEIVDDTEGDSPPWIQLTEDVRQRPLLFDCTNGAWSNLLSIRPGGQLACHYHTGPVHAFTLKGSWRYLEHDWVSPQGTFVYEPPGEVHTLQADPQTGM